MKESDKRLNWRLPVGYNPTLPQICHKLIRQQHDWFTKIEVEQELPA
jgi:hypothetical protein